ncbi:MAG: prolyl oligopeptidase family serine peptidase [Candidatus Krumholzibacteria bacterium]|nr:prolyl oligopeptidase family serine peptidase [Candidatus Krumholzibacteria bacterium]
MRSALVRAALAATSLAVLAGAAASKENRLVEFQGRQLDLAPYFEGFPYSGLQPFYAAGRLYLFHQGETTELRQVGLSGGVDLAKGRAVSDVDFSKRNAWGMRYNPRDKKIYWIGDEKNDEVINLYRLDPGKKTIEVLTGVPYIYGWRWDRDYKRVAYVARVGHREERLGQLRLLDLESGAEQVVVEDTPEMRFTWGSPSWQEQGFGVVVPALKDADRNHGNLAYVDFRTREVAVLTDASKPRSWPYADKWWIDFDEFVYVSNEDGYRNAYKYNIKSRHSLQLTRFERDIEDTEVVGFDGRRWLFCVLQSPIESELVLVDPKTGEIAQRETVDVNVSLLDSDKNRFFVSSTSATVKYRVDEIKIDPRRGFGFTGKVKIPDELRAKISHAELEKVEYPTFDIDPATGKARMLHAFLYRPANPPPPDRRVVMIQSFYGGSNEWSTQKQILCEAGVYVLSHSPRGSSGFGREFAALNDKDLGGNEILDIIYAGKWISEQLGVPLERIGVFGGSHGGYATMRLLTFPGMVNDVAADLAWGFGVSHAGFSDIIHFYEHCNIPDWVELEAGDPETEADKLRDRSPLYNARYGRGHLLLTHGANDSRVPVEGSRAMADSLRAHGKDVTLVEFVDQGHGIKGLENNIRYYGILFDFLEKVVTAAP